MKGMHTQLDFQTVLGEACSEGFSFDDEHEGDKYEDEEEGT
jgi:hypothetical protein